MTVGRGRGKGGLLEEVKVSVGTLGVGSDEVTGGGKDSPRAASSAEGIACRVGSKETGGSV